MFKDILLFGVAYCTFVLMITSTVLFIRWIVNKVKWDE